MNDPKASPSVVFTSKGDFFDPWIDKRRKAAKMMIVKAAIIRSVDDGKVKLNLSYFK